MRKLLYPFLITLFLVIFSGSAFSNAYEFEENVLAVQEKVFHKFHELTFHTGYITNDDFYEVFPVGISYKYNFSDRYSWEVARLTYNINAENGLKDDLEGEFGAAPEQFYEPIAQIVSHFVFRPFYGKDAVLNKKILNHETSFFIGGGLDIYEKRKSYGGADNEFGAVISFGAAKKYFINDKFAISFELNDTLIHRDGIENRIGLNLNFSFRFNMNSKKEKSAETIRIIEQYLEERENNE